MERRVQVHRRLQGPFWVLGLMLFSATASSSFAQDSVSTPVYAIADSGDEVRCDLIEPEKNRQLLKRLLKSGVKRPEGHLATRQGSSTWDVSLSGFSEEAGAAFLRAVDIWAARISSPAAIQVNAEFVAMENPRVLGGVAVTTLISNFPGSAPNTFYPVALANAMTASDLQPQGADVEISINSAFARWYFGTDANPAYNQVDLVSVVLHELGHGLGVIGSFNVDGADAGRWGFGGSPAVFDRFVVDEPGRDLTNTAIYPNPSIALGSALRSNRVFFDGVFTSRAALFAPPDFQPGSSISHLDESTYSPEGGNALRTPALSSGESQHDPGPLTQGILQDIGWEWTTPSVEPVTHDLYFAQFAFGEELSSELCLLSLSSIATTRALVTLKTHLGEPWALELNGHPVTGEFEIAVPPGGAIRLQTAKTGVVQRGSVRVTSDQPLDGLVLFTGPFGLAGIPPGVPSAEGFRTFVETDRDRAIDTGFAVVNLARVPTSLTVSLLNLDGSLAAVSDPNDEALVIPAEGQKSLFITDLSFSPPVDFSRFLGILSATAGHTVGATTIQTRPHE